MPNDAPPPDDTLRYVRDLAASVATMAAILEERQGTAAEDRETLRQIERQVSELRRELDRIVKPVSEHYDTLRVADENERANRGKWASILTPDKVVAVLRYVVPILAALGLGGGLGANFRGCSSAVVTARDVQPAENSGTSTP